MKFLLLFSILLSYTNIYYTSTSLDLKTIKQEENQSLFFKNLKEGDQLSITYQSYGCFNQHSETLEFKYLDKTLTATLLSNDIKKSTIIKPTEIDYLIEFETQLININNTKRGCTTVNSFTFKLNNDKSIVRKDDTCNWNGYKVLKEKFFK